MTLIGTDKGFQFCSAEYTNFTDKKNISLSLTEQYDPYENAITERINRTLKYEYALKKVNLYQDNTLCFEDLLT
jgi:transposase InsO family protein